MFHGGESTFVDSPLFQDSDQYKKDAQIQILRLQIKINHSKMIFRLTLTTSVVLSIVLCVLAVPYQPEVKGPVKVGISQIPNIPQKCAE